MRIDQYFDDYDRVPYLVDELPDLTVSLMLTIFGTMITMIAMVYLMLSFRT